MPVDAIPGLFLIGQSLTSADNAVLFQFFDFSHYNAFLQSYQLVDQLCYAAVPGGVPQKINQKMSELYMGTDPHPFTAEFRLVINNTHILNPYSTLSIKRYERNDSQQVKDYETQLREAIKKLPHDPEKAERYRRLLLNLWGQPDGS